VLSQDSGHDNARNTVAERNGAAAFGFDPQARADYGGASLEKTVLAAKALVGAYYGRVLCYQWLLVDGFPPIGGGSPDDGYPVRLTVDYPERQSRLTVFFRLLMAIPASMVAYALNLLLEILAFFAWLVIVFLGRLPRGIFEVMELPARFQVRLAAYAFLLLTDAYPWFQPESEATVPERSWDDPLPPVA